MATLENFKVVGKGFDLDPTDAGGLGATELRQFAAGVQKCLNKAFARVYGQSTDTYVLKQDVWADKAGDSHPNKSSGIFGRWREYVVGSPNDVRTGVSSSATGYRPYTEVEATISASKMQEVLVEEGVFVLKPGESPPEDKPSPGIPEAQTPPPPEPEPEAEEDPEPEKPPEIKPSENPSETKSEKVIVGETHFVDTKSDPLRIRSSPSFGNNILGRFPKDAKVRVVNEFLGSECNWHKVEIVDPDIVDALDGKKLVDKFRDRAGSLYSNSTYLKKLKGVPESLQHTCDVKVDPNAIPIDWRKLDPDGHCCFYNKKEGEYQALVELPFQSEEELNIIFGSFEDARIRVLEVGIKKLLCYYNKQNDSKTFSKIINAFKAAYIPTGASGFYLDRRPGSFMRFLVVFPAKYFNALPDRGIDLSRMSEGNADSRLRSYHFAWSPFKEKIEFVSKKMESLADDIDAADTEIQFLDLKSEAKRLREVPPALEELLLINGYPTSKMEREWTVEVGMTGDFKIDWVLLNIDDKRAFPLEIGFARSQCSEASGGSSLYSALYPDGFGFANVDPVNSPRTMAYLYFLDKMVEAIKADAIPKKGVGPKGSDKTASNKLTWSEFVNAFTYPIPRILPSAKATKKVSEKAKKESANKEKRQKKPPGEAKTTSELKKESRSISDPKQKLQAAEGRAKSKDVVGDSLFQDVEHVLRKIVKLDDIYDELLNKYSLEALAKIVLSFLSELVPFEDLQSLGWEKVIEQLPVDKVEQVLAKIRSVDPKTYDSAMSVVQKELEQTKEKGLKLAKKELVDYEATPGELLKGKSKASTKHKESSTSKAGKSLTASKQTSPPSLTSKSSAEGTHPALTVDVEGSEKQTVPSPTKIGKSEQYMSGIDDFGASTSKLLKDTGASITSQLPPGIRKQVAGVTKHLEAHLDDLIQEKQKMLKTMLKQGEDEAKQFVMDTLESLVPDELTKAMDTFSAVTDVLHHSHNEGPRAAPSIPLLDLADDLPTSDPMGFIVSMMEEAIEEALVSALMGIVTSVLKELQGIINDLLSGKKPDFGGLKNALPLDAVKDALDKLGKFAPEELLRDFIDDITEALTGVEVAELLEGKASEEVKQHIKSIVQHKHPDMQQIFPVTGAGIEKLFVTVGEFVDEDAIKFDKVSPLPSISGLLCDDDVQGSGGGSGDDYGGRLSAGRAKEQNDAERERLKDLAKRLADLSENANSALADITAGASCPEGIFPEDIPSMDHANDLVINAIFTSIKMAFTQDIVGFTEALTTREAVELQKGDAGYSDPEEAPFGWSPERCDKENKEKSQHVTRVAPALRADLRNKKTFEGMSVAKEYWGVNFAVTAIKAEAIPTPSEAEAQLQAAQAVLKGLEDELALVNESLEELKDEGLEDKNLEAKKTKLDAATTSQRTAIKFVMAEQMAEAGSENPVPKQEVIEGLKSITYEMAHGKDPALGFRDEYRVRTTESPVDPNNELGSALVSRNMPPSAPSDVMPSDTWEPSDTVSPAEAFASHISFKIGSAGAVPANTNYHDGLTSGYKEIFLDFVRKTAKQVAHSKLFDPDALDAIELLPDPSGNPSDPCAPDDTNEEDLLDIFNIVQDVKEEYGSQCEPLGQDENAVSVLENTCKTGVVKITTRVFMLETLLRSIFSLSEFNAEALAGDRLLLDYINHSMEEGLGLFNPGFYNDLTVAAKEIINKRALNKAPIEDPSGVIDMDVLLNDESKESGKEALKFLAMEQLPDLVSKLNAKLGTKTSNIHRRFTDPPPPIVRDGESESTNAGSATLVPKGPGGWIRTIDVPTDYRYGGHDRKSKGNRFLRVTGGSKSLLTANAGNTVELKYPDLIKSSGTFFIEKYIRIEDKGQMSANADPSLGKHIRERAGGPDNPNPTWANNIPHLGGVVNIEEWNGFIGNLADHPAFGAAKISDFFKPWKYGLRLVWVPPMNKKGLTVAGMRKWDRFTKEFKTAVDIASFTDPLLLVAWTAFKETDPLSLLDMSEGDADWEETTSADHFNGEKNKNQKKALNPKSLEHHLAQAFSNNGGNIEIARREKAFFLEEQIDLYNTEEASLLDLAGDSTAASGLSLIPGVDKAALITKMTRYQRPVFVFPLTSVEKEVGGSNNLDDYTKLSAFDKKSDLNESPSSPFAKLRQELLESPEYKFLFEYVFPLPRIQTLMTIYNANSMALSKPEIKDTLNSTKEACRSLFYQLSPEEGKEWWQRQDETVAEMGGNAGAMQKHLKNQTTKGPSTNLLPMVLRTVPLLIRGVADVVDPHYALVSKLHDAGVWPLKKNWSSVFPLYPSTLPPGGWGPPLTPPGMLAYSMPQLEGDKKKFKENKLKKKLADAEATGEDACEDDSVEELE